jgi:hypothetical protein
MDLLNVNTLYVPMMTAFGAVSSFPKSSFFGKLGENELFQWFCVFILIMQGGGGTNVQLSVVATVLLYVVVKAVDMFLVKNEGYHNY